VGLGRALGDVVTTGMPSTSERFSGWGWHRECAVQSESGQGSALARPWEETKEGDRRVAGGALVTSLVFSAFQAQGTSTREE
jgi:hypothetical protein